MHPAENLVTTHPAAVCFHRQFVLKLSHYLRKNTLFGKTKMEMFGAKFNISGAKFVSLFNFS